MRTASGMGCSGWSQGELRLVKRFSLIPRCVNGCWYWFTRLYVIQEYRPHTSLNPGAKATPSYKWINKGWSVIRPGGTFFMSTTEDSSKFVLQGS